VLVTVNDATPHQNGSSTWQSDCVELFFAMDTNTHAPYQSGDWQIRKLASKSQADSGVDGNGSIASLLANPNFKVVQKDIPTGYVQEWQLPIDSLVQGAKFDGQNFRFDIQLADNDGTGRERTAQRFWNSNADNQGNQTTNMGYVKMEWPLAVKQAIAKASSIRIKANSIEFAKMAKEVNVYSITGQLMVKARNVNAISTSALKSGVYFVVADGEKAKFVIK